jgi:hypothetical protein
MQWKEIVAPATTQELYAMLIASKNEWNARAARGDKTTGLSGAVGTMKKAYLHFELQPEAKSLCACENPNLMGRHAEFACTITKQSV